MKSRTNPYPGDEASAAALLRLADEYRAAAKMLLALGRRSEPLSFAPFRLTAIHAAELYLSALLVHGGRSFADVRALGHDVAARANLASELGLKLRKRTLQHLGAVSEGREYVVSRYGVERRSLSQVNRLTATLEELSAKVRISILTPKKGVGGALSESAEPARR